jgi:hypothetical protein
LTHYDELEARSTMSRMQLAIDDGEPMDAAAAALGWRQAARLAGNMCAVTRTPGRRPSSRNCVSNVA